VSPYPCRCPCLFLLAWAGARAWLPPFIVSRERHTPPRYATPFLSMTWTAAPVIVSCSVRRCASQLAQLSAGRHSQTSSDSTQLTRVTDLHLRFAVITVCYRRPVLNWHSLSLIDNIRFPNPGQLRRGQSRSMNACGPSSFPSSGGNTNPGENCRARRVSKGRSDPRLRVGLCTNLW
jgi:hypothetical protein